MSALETAREILVKLGKQYKSGQHVHINRAIDAIDQAAAELAQLQEDAAKMIVLGDELSAMQYDRDKLRAENAELKEKFDERGNEILDREEIIAQLRAEMREAVKPFAGWAKTIYESYDNDYIKDMWATAGEIRRAAAVLAKYPEVKK